MTLCIIFFYISWRLMSTNAPKQIVDLIQVCHTSKHELQSPPRSTLANATPLRIRHDCGLVKVQRWMPSWWSLNIRDKFEVLGGHFKYRQGLELGDSTSWLRASRFDGRCLGPQNKTLKWGAKKRWRPKGAGSWEMQLDLQMSSVLLLYETEPGIKPCILTWRTH